MFALTIPFTMLFAPALIAPVCAKAIVAGVVAVGAACAGKVVSDAVGWSWSPSEADCYDYVSGSFGVVGTCASQMSRSRKENREENFSGAPQDLEKNPDWKETSHPKELENGSREFTNIKTGEKIRYDKGRPGKTGHEAHDHYHKYNPNKRKGKAGDNEYYLDKDGNPIHKNNRDSHLYPPKGVYWE